MKGLTSMIVAGVALVGGLWLIWEWGFCRFYVPPDHLAILIAKGGDDLPPGEILAKPGQKGVQADVLGEGRHFRNPFMFDHKIVRVLVIPPGKVGIVTSKVGAQPPPGEFLVEPGQKGIWRPVLGPGKYRFNPEGYQIDVTAAVSIPVGFVGVMTSLSGEQTPQGEFAKGNQKGVRQEILQPGLYYVNPKEYTIDALEVGVNQVSLLGAKGSEVITKRQIASQNVVADELQASKLAEQSVKREDYISQSQSMRSVPNAPAAASQEWKKDRSKDKRAAKPAATQSEQAPTKPEDSMATFALTQFVEFPSRDGFAISLDMTVEFELLPEAIAMIFRTYGDLPAVVDKIILPQILSVSRLKGSAYQARDFIVGEGREKFQKDLTDALAATLKEKHIVIHEALIRHVGVPMQILDPIQQASIATEQDKTNKEMQNTAKKQAELNTEQSLIEQRREQVMQETEKLKAEIKADQENQVAQTRATALKSVAEIEKDTSAVRADKTRKLGEAESKVIVMVEGEKANGSLLKVKAFEDPAAYSLWEFANRLSDDLKINILHSGPGTLWTDLEKARLGDLGGAKMLQKQPSEKP